MKEIGGQFDYYYILDTDGKTAIPVGVLTWGKWFEKANRTVRKDTIGDVDISTVFLGLDHNFMCDGIPHPPVLWETMIFGGEYDQYQERYSSYEDAVEGHERAMAIVLGSSSKEQKVEEEILPNRKFRKVT